MRNSKPKFPRKPRKPNAVDALMLILVFTLGLVMIYAGIYYLLYSSDRKSFVYNEQALEIKLEEIKEKVQRKLLADVRNNPGQESRDTMLLPELFNVPKPITIYSTVFKDTIRSRDRKTLLRRLDSTYLVQKAKLFSEKVHIEIGEHDTVFFHHGATSLTKEDSTTILAALNKLLKIERASLLSRIDYDSAMQRYGIIKEHPNAYVRIRIPPGVIYIFGDERIAVPDSGAAKSKWKEYTRAMERTRYIDLWAIEDFLYFSALSITGGGSGDMVPSTTVARLWVASEVMFWWFIIIFWVNLTLFRITQTSPLVSYQKRKKSYWQMVLRRRWSYKLWIRRNLKDSIPRF